MGSIDPLIEKRRIDGKVLAVKIVTGSFWDSWGRMARPKPPPERFSLGLIV